MMKYQLVLQFPEAKYGDLDFIIAIEDMLDESLQDAMVDGHDMGSGEMNIFLDTNNPVATFSAVKDILEAANSEILEDIKVAYRDFTESRFTCLWPENLDKFSVIA